MSRKDYVSVAKELADLLYYCTDDGRGDIRAEGIADAAKALADAFQRDNSRFDRQRFYFAAGLDPNGKPLAKDGEPRPAQARAIP